MTTFILELGFDVLPSPAFGAGRAGKEEKGLARRYQGVKISALKFLTPGHAYLRRHARIRTPQCQGMRGQFSFSPPKSRFLVLGGEFF